jgi:hypothetical protein
MSALAKALHVFKGFKASRTNVEILKELQELMKNRSATRPFDEELFEGRKAWNTKTLNSSEKKRSV